MALSDDNMYMPVTPAYGNSGFGGDWGWIILLLLFAGGGFGGWGGGFNGALGTDFPWLLNGQNGINANTNAGFDHAATQSAISGLQSSVTSGFGDVATQLCGGFAGVTAAVNGSQSALAQQMYTNQIADLERSFAAQTANTAGMSALQSQLAQCCCDNRLATAQTQALVQSENCADRYEAAQNTSAIIQAINGGIQAIKDDLCQDRLDAERRENQNLRSELMFARGQASQDVQTAAIQAGQRALANEVEQYVAPRPIPSYTVASPYCCNAYGCGCGA